MCLMDRNGRVHLSPHVVSALHGFGAEIIDVVVKARVSQRQGPDLLPLAGLRKPVSLHLPTLFVQQFSAE